MWVNQGRTDAWIAHKLDVSIDDLTRFKREHELDGEGTSRLRPADPLSVPPPEPAAEQDEDEEPEEEPEQDEPEDEVKADRAPRGRRSGREAASPARRPRRDSGGAPRGRRPRRDELDEDAPAERRPRGEDPGDEGDGEPQRRRRRGRRGGRRHRGRRNALEATFDHGEEGYGLWLDPAVVDNPVYSEHWAGHRAVTVVLEADSITIRRAGAAAGPGDDDAAEPVVEEQD
jgi:hypothetical protein